MFRVALAKEDLDAALAPLDAQVNGDPERTSARSINISIPGVDSEAAIVALKDVVALSNVSVCTSQSYEPSHVRRAGSLPLERFEGALWPSWNASTGEVPVDEIARRLQALRRAR
jgi:cysteine desulfurase